jgi:hypothetical protein
MMHMSNHLTNKKLQNCKKDELANVGFTFGVLCSRLHVYVNWQAYAGLGGY